MTLTKEDLVAVHEAGHALIDFIAGKTINYVTIIPTDSALGECNSDFKSELTGEDALDFRMDVKCLECLAGITAENIVLGIEPEKCSKHGNMDVLVMGGLVSQAFDNPVVADKYINFITQKVRDTINTPLARQQIIAVAEELKKHKTLSGEQVVQIMNQYIA